MEHREEEGEKEEEKEEKETEEAYLEPLATDSVPIHALASVGCSSRVSEADKAVAHALACSLVDDDLGVHDTTTAGKQGLCVWEGGDGEGNGGGGEPQVKWLLTFPNPHSVPRHRVW